MVFTIYLIYGLIFAFLAWKRFPWAVYILIATLPVYLIRFSIGPLPSTLLELNFGIIFAIWLIKYARTDVSRISHLISHHKILSTAYCLLLTSSFISIFFSVDRFAALGIWRAFFLEPMIFFVMLVGRFTASPYEGEVGWGLPSFTSSPTLSVKATTTPTPSFERRGNIIILWSLIVASLPVSLLAILQKITGSFFPPSLWDDYLFGRVTSFFTSPNAVGLFLEPIFFINLYLIAQKWKELKMDKSKKNKILISILIFSLLSLFFSIAFTLSVGTWLGITVGLLVLIFLLGWKKISIAIIVLTILAAFFLPPLHKVLLSKSQSTTNRFALWSYSWEYLSAAPSHFVFGSGLRSFFEHVQAPHYNPRKLEALTYPHNIILNFWTEAGLVGAVAFLTLYFCLSLIAYRLYRHTDRLLGAIFFSLLIAYFVHGLIDVPYFKNDLSMLFWILASLVIASPAKAGRGDPLGCRTYR